MATPLRVLILEDRPTDAELMVHELRRGGFEADWQRVDNEADYLACLDPALDLVLADYSLPQWDAPRALRALQERGLDIPFIMISGSVGEDVAVECMKQGAADYLLKDRMARLGQAVERGLSEAAERRARKRAEEALRRRDALLGALTYISEQLLRSTDLDAVLPDALAQLGEAAGVSRAHIFENHTAPDGTLFTSCRYEWVTPSPDSPITALSIQNVAYADGFSRWVDILSEGQVLYGIVRELPARERATLEAQSILSQVTVPIFAGEAWWGFLGFDDCEHEREWLPAEIDALRNVASTFGAALVRQRAEKAEREQRAQAEALSDTAAVLTSALDLDVVMNRILEAVGRVVSHDAANIMLVEGDYLRITGWRGYSPQIEPFLNEFHRPLKEMLSLQGILATGLPLLVADTASSPGWVAFPETAWIRSYLAVPIRAHGQVIGFLNLDSSTPGFFTQVHAERLQAFANQAAIAIENARFYDEVRRYAQDLEQRVEERTAQINHQKERIEAILNSSQDVVILCRTDGTIDQVNPAFDQTFGTQPDEVVLKPLTNLVIPAHVPILEHAFETVVETGRPKRLEVTAQYQKGSAFDADMLLSPVVEPNDRLLGVVCSLRDMTQRKQMEAQLRQMLRREMELSELKTRYVSMAAHDLRNPLAVIRSSVDVVSQYSERLTDQQKQVKYDHVYESIKVMVDILDDILTIGQIESGKLAFNPGPVDVLTFCQNMVAEAKQASGTTQRIDFSSQRGCGTASLDAKLLRHILSNLLSNALKYSPGENAVTLTAACEPEQIMLRVQDRGIGIPQADQARLFEAFHRASNARQIPGTGLGLAIVKQSVELHGGTITFESQESVGTTFTVILPQTPA
jgi:PAS domain S-box-containing protein